MKIAILFLATVLIGLAVANPSPNAEADGSEREARHYGGRGWGNSWGGYGGWGNRWGGYSGWGGNRYGGYSGWGGYGGYGGYGYGRGGYWQG